MLQPTYWEESGRPYEQPASPKELKVSKWACGMALAVFLLAGAFLRGVPGQGPDGQEPLLSQEQADLLRTLIAGLRHRESMIHSVSGSATVRTFYGDMSWIGSEVANEVAQKRHEGTLSDWDMVVYNFDLGEQQWWYEGQMLRWAGVSPGFLVGPDPHREAHDVADLYLVVACDGQYIYRIDRSRKAPRGMKSRVRSPTPGYLRHSVGGWLGLGDAAGTFSNKIDPHKQKNMRLHSVIQEEVNGISCYKITYGIETPEFMQETQVWIAPDQDYSPVRWETFNVYKLKPRCGFRLVFVWSDFRKVDDQLILPHRQVFSRFGYGTASPEAWQFTREVQFDELHLNRDVSFNFFDHPFPPATILELDPEDAPSSGVADRETAEQVHRSMRPWSIAGEAFGKPTPPPVEERYRAQLTGNELQELLDKYGFTPSSSEGANP